MDITVDDAEVRRLLTRLESAEPFKAGLKAMGGYLRGRMAVYPPTDGTRPPQKFVSERQRRWFFAALNDGSLKIPYRRTGNLAKKWGQSEEDGGLTVIVGNDAGYAPFVVGHETQAVYMRSLGWKTTADVVEAEGDNAFRTFSAGFRQSMQGRG